MRRGTYIGVCDRNGKKLHVGDYVVWLSGVFWWKGEMKKSFYVLKLHYDKKRKMVILNDNLYNIWKGKDVIKISPKQYKSWKIPLYKEFFIENDTPTILTGIHYCGGDEEAYNKMVEHEMELTHELFFGPQK